MSASEYHNQTATPTSEANQQRVMNRIADAALLLIDVQCGIDELPLGERNNPDAESNIGLLLLHWREHGRTVIHVQHDSTEPASPLRPEHPGNAIKAQAQPLPGEPVFRKNVNSAFIGTGLEDHLQQLGCRKLLIAGLTTDHCVSTSVRMAANLGFEVILASDATATFERTGPTGIHFDAEQMHQANLASLHGEFCSVIDTASLIAA